MTCCAGLPTRVRRGIPTTAVNILILRNFLRLGIFLATGGSCSLEVRSQAQGGGAMERDDESDAGTECRWQKRSCGCGGGSRTMNG